MNKNGVIIFVDDDEDDKYLVCEIIKELNIPNKVIWLKNGEEAYHYLNNNIIDPFIIISDINMPKMNGMQLREKMQLEGQLKLRTVPFLFLTTGAVKDNIITAYANSVQGFFQKRSNYSDLKNVVKLIVDYWRECTEPRFQ